jgi:predicted amidophosphoribosyltransferase
MIEHNTTLENKKIDSSEIKQNYNLQKDWTEDFRLEFGKSECICCICHDNFRGFKHRVICKECGKKLSEHTL